MAEQKGCPVCHNTEYFTIEASSSDGYNELINCTLGSISLLVCTECGCVYVGEKDLARYKRRKEGLW